MVDRLHFYGNLAFRSNNLAPAKSGHALYHDVVYSFAIDKSIIIQMEKQVNGFVAIGFAFL